MTYPYQPGDPRFDGADAYEAHQKEAERYGAGGVVRRSFVILKDQNKVPEGKGPFLTEDQLEQFVREAIDCRPTDTEITVCQLTWNDELWVECGRERIQMHDMQ